MVDSSYKMLYYEAPEADGVIVPCNRWPIIGHVALLEREIENPVVAAGPAYIWYDLKQIRAGSKFSGSECSWRALNKKRKALGLEC